MLEFEKPRALANCFPIFDNTSSLTILILSTIIIHQAVHKLDIVFDFPCLFLTPIARLVWMVLPLILSATALIGAVIIRFESCDRKVHPNPMAWTTLLFLIPPLPQM